MCAETSSAGIRIAPGSFSDDSLHSRALRASTKAIGSPRRSLSSISHGVTRVTPTDSVCMALFLSGPAGAVFGRRQMRFAPMADAALIAPAKGLRSITVRVALPELRRDPFVGLALAFRMKRRDKAFPVMGFIGTKMSSALFVVLPLGLTDADPPLLASGVEAFGAGLLHRRLGAIGFLFGVGHDEDDRVAMREGVSIQVHLVFRKA